MSSTTRYLNVIKYNVGTIGDDTGMIEAHLVNIRASTETPPEEELKQATNGAKDATIACAFVLGADKASFGKLVENLENDFTQGVNQYPMDLTN